MTTQVDPSQVILTSSMRLMGTWTSRGLDKQQQRFAQYCHQLAWRCEEAAAMVDMAIELGMLL